MALSVAMAAPAPAPGQTAPGLLHLRAAGTSLVLDCSGPYLPRVLHWGAHLGELSPAALDALVLSTVPQTPSGGFDAPVQLRVLPEQADGWLGMPGVSGHRNGAGFVPRFLVQSVQGPGGDGRRLTVCAEDRTAGLALELRIEVTAAGLVGQRLKLTNIGAGVYTLDSVLLGLPLPPRATELLDMTGRHLRERSPQRHLLPYGTYSRDGRRGRPGLDASLLLIAGEAGFGFRSGQVWGISVAWSGNSRLLAERDPSGLALLAGGELAMPGEIRLAEGESYESPEVYASHGEGLDALSARFHSHLRARALHPRTPRPVTVNSWEAVYFDHDLPRLTAIADIAADLGAERFVLDDGWFLRRRHDRAALGDWQVDPDLWPDGLHPLADHVTGLGMQFGLWVEPEMVNPDSDLARAHPDWMLSAGNRLPPPARHQQVLNLAHPDAYEYLLGALDALLTEYPISYLKWDHNRDLTEAGDPGTGSAGVHAQTLALYRLLDTLKALHPGLEVESCASGGGRIDLGILEHTDRVWTSDCIDPLERQQIQRWTGLLLPPELMGSHVGAPVAHTTGRTAPLRFRAGTALFGSFGIEWDLSKAGAADLAELAAWIGVYKRLRPLLHTGTVVRGDVPDPALLVHGVVSEDRETAVFALVQQATSITSPPGAVRLPGLDPDATYAVAAVAPGNVLEGPTRSGLPWLQTGVALPGRVLAEVGVQAPTLYPERMVLLEVTRV